MKDGAIQTCVGIGGIIAVYAIYSFNNPGTDGYLFGTVAAIIAGLAGYKVAKTVIAKKAA